MIDSNIIISFVTVSYESCRSKYKNRSRNKKEEPYLLKEKQNTITIKKKIVLIFININRSKFNENILLLVEMVLLSLPVDFVHPAMAEVISLDQSKLQPQVQHTSWCPNPEPKRTERCLLPVSLIV